MFVLVTTFTMYSLLIGPDVSMTRRSSAVTGRTMAVLGKTKSSQLRFVYCFTIFDAAWTSLRALSLRRAHSTPIPSRARGQCWYKCGEGYLYATINSRLGIGAHLAPSQPDNLAIHGQGAKLIRAFEIVRVKILVWRHDLGDRYTSIVQLP